MDQDQIVSRVAELIETEVDGDIVALDVERGTCFGFNATAARVWALAEHPVPVRTIVAQLGDEFEVAPQECERDVAALLDSMRDQGLIRLD